MRIEPFHYSWPRFVNFFSFGRVSSGAPRSWTRGLLCLRAQAAFAAGGVHYALSKRPRGRQPGLAAYPLCGGAVLSPREARRASRQPPPQAPPPPPHPSAAGAAAATSFDTSAASSGNSASGSRGAVLPPPGPAPVTGRSLLAAASLRAATAGPAGATTALPAAADPLAAAAALLPPPPPPVKTFHSQGNTDWRNEKDLFRAGCAQARSSCLVVVPPGAFILYLFLVLPLQRSRLAQAAPRPPLPPGRPGVWVGPKVNTNDMDEAA